jgi:molybdenum cofactor cytidylyltransferase
LLALFEFAARNPTEICQPIQDGHGRHPLVLPRAAFEKLAATTVENLKAFLQSSGVPVRQIPIDDPGLALDLDRPEDYQQALRLSADVK